jgi:hypothetical protein
VGSGKVRPTGIRSIISFLTRFFQILISLAGDIRILALVPLKSAAGDIAFRLDSFAGIERLPPRGSIIRA